MVNTRDMLDLTLARPTGAAGVEWRIADAPVAYLDAVALMEARVAAIAAGQAPELVWLVESLVCAKGPSVTWKFPFSTRTRAPFELDCSPSVRSNKTRRPENPAS